MKKYKYMYYYKTYGNTYHLSFTPDGNNKTIVYTLEEEYKQEGIIAFSHPQKFNSLKLFRDML